MMPPSTTDRPRERLARVPLAHLLDAEVLALVLGTGRPGQPVETLAESLLERHGGLGGLVTRGLGELEAERGLGPTRAARLLAAAELGRRAAATPLVRGTPLRSSRDVESVLGAQLAAEEVERVVVLPLDARHRARAVRTVAIGSVASCAVRPADVLRPVVREASIAFVMVHNHPSGDPSPSPDDVALTARVAEAAAVVGVRLLDHVILAREGTYSFLDAGVLPACRGRADDDG